MWTAFIMIMIGKASFNYQADYTSERACNTGAQTVISKFQKQWEYDDADYSVLRGYFVCVKGK